MATELTWNVAFPRRAGATRRLMQAVRFTRLCANIITVWLASAVFKNRLASPPQRDRPIQRWSRRLLSSLNVELRLKGTPVPPGQAVLFVANHVSWLDTPVLNSVDAARFVTKSEVQAWLIIGDTAARFGSFFIDRCRWRDAMRVKDLVAASLRGGGRVAVFPEATTTDGTRLRFFYAAIFQAAIDAGAVVQPVAIRYPGKNGAPNRAPAFIGDMTVIDSLFRILREPKLGVEIAFGDPLSTTGKSRRQLATKAQRLIALELGIPRTRMETRYLPFRPADEPTGCPPARPRIGSATRAGLDPVFSPLGRQNACPPCIDSPITARTTAALGDRKEPLAAAGNPGYIDIQMD